MQKLRVSILKITKLDYQLSKCYRILQVIQLKDFKKNFRILNDIFKAYTIHSGIDLVSIL